ncbi:hypothetical protein PF005_g26000 [Phytophthora fragariae]|uniref:Secreted protein n=2 Tax=Phytophthora TaxID=4783 RepID=A0A6A3VVA0_9STRA|nr:hypothetical protein PF003_g35707 [Phytophthora fragariae]KAE9027711.1 hypothetical protein PR002_g10596 [Phytophthora rubi]KAE8944129.1 hypothetical protein PF009_g6187 [Phytophthora fragariae]KAE8974513.1 hypothetical protein PF011_g24833 [Phytophthora fragariae]KAE9077542.1 hypothetical protein PF010_g23474 [Phytophthora fragariae]
MKFWLKITVVHISGLPVATACIVSFDQVSLVDDPKPLITPSHCCLISIETSFSTVCQQTC